MFREVDNQSVFIYTGGRRFDPTLPVVVLIHGAGHDHSVWNFQARALAHHGLTVVAPDLPGHGRSPGPPLPDIESLATWIDCLLDALDVRTATIVGHSMGSLIALQYAASAGERVDRLILVGSVAPMPVAAPLLEAAARQPARAHAMINQWSYTPAHRLGASPVPGMVLANVNQCIMERQPDKALATDLAACNAYQGGLAAAESVTCPVALICGERDQMTPAKAARALHAALANQAPDVRIITLNGAGHAMMAEAPDQLSIAIRGFLSDYNKN